MQNSVLFVDDEKQILAGFHRQLDDYYDVHTAESGAEGLKLAKEINFSVVVSDYQMPKMNGLQFLTKMREISPQSVRVMLTGQADFEAVVNVVNEGSIFRFLTKPCTAPLMKQTLSDAIEYYELANAEKELLSKTLTGSLQVMSDLLVIARPKAFSQSIRIRELVRKIISQMEVGNGWQIEIASMLSQIGCITVPADIMDKVWRNLVLNDEEKRIYLRQAVISGELISRIPRMEKVAEIITYQNKHFDGRGFPADGRSEDEIPLGSRILKVALDYDQLISADKTAADAIATMKKRQGRYDPGILGRLEQIVPETPVRKKYKIKKADISELSEGMYFSENLISSSGIVIGEKKQLITKPLIETIRNYSERGEISEPISVLTQS